MRIIRAHDHIVDALAFSPNGRLIASSANETIRLHDSNTGELVGQWTGFLVASMRFLPDGSALLLSGFSGLWLQPISGAGPTWAGSDGWCSAAALSPDGRTAAVYHASYRQEFDPSRRATLRRFRIDTGEEIPGGWGGTQEPNAGDRWPALGLAYSPDGKLLATCFQVRAEGHRTDVLFWDAQTGEHRGEFTAALTHEVEQIAFSPDGAILAARNGPRLLAWDVRTLTPEATRKTGLQHFKEMAFTPDGRRLITVNNDKAARVWDTATWTEIRAHDWKINKLRSVAVSPDGLRIAAGSINGKIVVWDNDD